MPPAGFRLSFPADLQPTSLCPARSAVYTAHFSWSPGETRSGDCRPVARGTSPSSPLVAMSFLTYRPAWTSLSSGCTERSRARHSPRPARIEAGTLLGQLQGGQDLGFCRTRARCGRPSNAATRADSGYERAVADRLRLDADAVIIVEVFSRKTPATPQACWPSAHAVSERHDRATRRAREQFSARTR